MGLTFASFLFAIKIAQACELGIAPVLKVGSLNAKEVAESIKESVPFPECDNEEGRKSLRDRPHTGFFDRTIPEKDLKNRSIFSFFDALIGEARAELQSARLHAKELRACIFNNKPIDSYCEAYRALIISAQDLDKNGTIVSQQRPIKTNFKDLIALMRFHLALSPHRYERLKDSANLKELALNTDLEGHNIFKKVEWKPLDSTERRIAEGQLQSYKDAVQQGTLDMDRAFEQFGGIRTGHHFLYANMLASFPLAQFISSADPADKEIKEAFDKVDQAADRQQEYLDEMQIILDESKKIGKVSPHLKSLVSQAGAFFKVLSNNPQFCGVIDSFFDKTFKIEMQNFAVNFASLGAGSIIFPPAGIPLFLASSAVAVRDIREAFSFVNVQADYVSSRAIASELGNAKPLADLDFSKRSAVFSAVLLPLSATVGPGIRVGAKLLRQVPVVAKQGITSTGIRAGSIGTKLLFQRNK